MITKKELNESVKEYKKMYFHKNIFVRIIYMFMKNQSYEIGRAIINANKYYYYKNRNNILSRMYAVFLGRKHSFYANNQNIEIDCIVGKGLKIYHRGIIIGEKSIIGNNVTLHGNNCIGNNGKTDLCPKIGDNVDIGIGANIIGNIEIADDIIIGANSLVNKSFTEKGITIAGVPAKKIK